MKHQDHDGENMEKKDLKIKFVDMSPSFNVNYGNDYKTSIIYQLLSRRYNLIDSDDPQLAVCEFNGIEFKKYDCVRLFVSAENYKPDFDLYDYCITLFPDYKFQDRCFTTHPMITHGPNRTAYDKAMQKHYFTMEDLKAKTGFCNFVYSNYNAFKERKEFFDLLSQYKRVDSGGRYMNNIGHSVDNKLEFQSHYKFSIAFDNQYHCFVQEKISDAFGARTIPIYFGNPDVVKQYNPKAFINCHDFNNFSDVVEYVKKVDTDDELYMSMMREPMCDPKFTLEYYLAELESFLVRVVETGTVQRAKELWPVWLEKERSYGRARRLRQEKLAADIGKMFRPLRKTKIAGLIRKKLLWTR